MTARSLSFTAAALALLSFSPAQADIVWRNVDATPTAPVAKVEAAATDATAAQPVPADQVVVGFGSGVTLEMALLQIVPEKVKVKVDPTLDRNMLVSWEGGRPWTRVISDAVAPFGVRAEYKGDTLEVGRVRPATPSVTTPAMTATAAPKPLVGETLAPIPTGAVGISSASSTALASTSLAGDAMKVWPVRQNSSLRQTIEEWSRMAGWNAPDWRANVDWRLNAGHTFSGEFEKAGVDLFTHFVQRFEQSDPPLSVCFFRANKVVVVGPQREIQPACQGQIQQTALPNRVQP